ncbi:hypothetical protein MMC16_003752 [Acarospora aff. strigata]|nr:hypothetical protein [Acarospora aff. strigata]
MDMLDSPENHYMLEVLRRVFKGSILCVGNTEPCAAALQLDKIILRDLVKANARYEAFSKRQADERIAKGDKVDTKDVLYFLQKAKDPYTGEGYTLHELVAEASLLVLRDTTTTATASTPFYLLHNPFVLAKLISKVRAAFAEAEGIRESGKLNNCRYLQACIGDAADDA